MLQCVEQDEVERKKRNLRDKRRRWHGKIRYLKYMRESIIIVKIILFSYFVSNK